MRHADLADRLNRLADNVALHAAVLDACANEDMLRGVRQDAPALRRRALETARDAYDMRERADRYRRAAARSRRLASRPGPVPVVGADYVIV